MNIARWLLCHLLSIILLLSFVLIFSFRDELKSDFSSLVGEVTQAEINELKKLDTGSVVTDKNNKKKHEEKNEKTIPADPAKVTRVESRAAAPQQRVDDPWRNVLDGVNKQAMDSAKKPVADAALKSNFPPENYDPESSVAEDNNMQPMAMYGPEKAASHAGDMETENTATATEDYFLALKEARRLYWEGKTGPAQAAYERLMFKYQDMPEAAAELGNMLLQQGDKNGATWAYKNAIPRYLSLHREQEAISIMKLLSQYDPAIVEKLQKKYW